ncbi:MAG: hypothetical protein ACYCY9_13785 [Thiobacillus sp.]
MQGFARLAFWRKSAGPRPQQPETTVPEELMDLNPLGAEPDADADTDTPEPQVGRFARLTHALRWRRNAAPEHPAEPDQAAAMQPASLEHAEASEPLDETPAPRRSLLARLKNSLRRHPGAETTEAEADESIPSPGQRDATTASSESVPASDDVAPAPPRSLLARLKNSLRRHPGPETIEAEVDEAIPSPGQRDATTAFSEADPSGDDEATLPQPSLLARLKNRLRRHPGAETLEMEADESISRPAQDDEAAASSEDDSDTDGDAVQPGRIRRMLAMLSNKWVWIPGVSVVLLALMGAMLVMLLQSTRENEQLQAELLATQKKLEQTGVAKKAAVRADVPRPAGDPAYSAGDSVVADNSRGMDDGDCQVSDKASVTQNLRNCIDNFNRSMAESRSARTTP